MTIPVLVLYQHGNGPQGLLAITDVRGLELLAKLVTSDEASISDLAADQSRPLLDDERVLRHLRIVPTDTLVDIQVEDDTVVIRGNSDSRAVIAQRIEFLRSRVLRLGRSHAHIEYLPDSTFMQPQSLELVVGT